MTTMMEVPLHEAAQPSSISQIAQSAMSYNIKRVGGRPLRFDGSELAMAMSYTPSIPYWYEINLYRTVEQSFVTAVRRFYQSEDQQDTVQAWQSESLDEAIEQLIAYDAANDVSLTLSNAPVETPPAEAAANALQLVASIGDARNHYRSLVGEFLFDLENGN